MVKALRKAIVIVFCFAIGSGFSGYLYGRFVLTKTGVDWWLPDNLIDRNDFIVVGSIHNFSYLGGLVGLTVGIGYLIRLKNRYQSFLKSSNVNC